MDIKPGDTIVITPWVFLAMIANEMRKAASDPAAIHALADKVSLFAEAARRDQEIEASPLLSPSRKPT
jgi:hypothetical protein